jgi:hypothetical protein
MWKVEKQNSFLVGQQLRNKVEELGEYGGEKIMQKDNNKN